MLIFKESCKKLILLNKDLRILNITDKQIQMKVLFLTSLTGIKALLHYINYITIIQENECWGY